MKHLFNKFVEKLPLPLFNMWIHIKCGVRRDKGIFRQQAQNTREIAICKDYNL